MGLIIKNLDMPDENTTIIFTVKKNKAKLQVFKKVEDNTVIHKIVSDVVELEKPHQFIFKLLIFSICLNCSYFICEKI